METTGLVVFLICVFLLARYSPSGNCPTEDSQGLGKLPSGGPPQWEECAAIVSTHSASYGSPPKGSSLAINPAGIVVCSSLYIGEANNTIGVKAPSYLYVSLTIPLLVPADIGSETLVTVSWIVNEIVVTQAVFSLRTQEPIYRLHQESYFRTVRMLPGDNFSLSVVPSTKLTIPPINLILFRRNPD